MTNIKEFFLFFKFYDTFVALMWQSHGGILFSFYSMGWVDDDDRPIIHNNNDDEAILIVLRARETFRRVERLSTDWQPLATMARLLYQFSLSLSPCPRFLYHTHTLSLSLSRPPPYFLLCCPLFLSNRLMVVGLCSVVVVWSASSLAVDDDTNQPSNPSSRDDSYISSALNYSRACFVDRASGSQRGGVWEA